MKHTILLFFFAILYTHVYAQPEVKTQKSLGGSVDDFFTTMALTSDGGVIAGGYSFSNRSGEKSENRRGDKTDDDYWIVKLDKNSRLQWEKTLGSFERDEMQSVIQTTDGGYLLGGNSFSNAGFEKSENKKGNNCNCSDYWIIKLDSAGNILWDKTIGGNRDEMLAAVRQTTDGGYILGGYSNSGISYDKMENSRGFSDYWVVKTDNLGNIQWSKTIGGDNNDKLSSLELTADGGYIVAGNSNSTISGEKTEASRGDIIGFQYQDDYWVVKLDNLGNIEWDKTIGGSFNELRAGVKQLSSGDFVVAGDSESDSGFEKSENNRGSNFPDYWVVKLSSTGQVLWDKTIGGDNYDMLGSLETTSDGGIILGGTSGSGESGEKTEPLRGAAFDMDYWVVKLRANGSIQWDKTIGGDSADYLLSVKEIRKNLYTLGGYSQSAISDDKTTGTRGKKDYWLLTLINRTGTGAVAADTEASLQKKPAANAFAVYPNPAKDVLHIQINGSATISVADQSGKILVSKTISNGGDINVSGLAAGIYYVKNITSGLVQKIIIAN